MKTIISAALGLLTLAWANSALASNCPSYPYTLTNGTTADANQVMANFNSILNCSNGFGSSVNQDVATSGANLGLLSTPNVWGGAPQTFAASTTGAASINLPPGTAPSSPNNGDVWTTTSGAFVQINGVTQPLGGQPVYNTSGTLQTAQHIVTGSANTGGGAAVTVTLTGAAIYTSSSTYRCFTTSSSGTGITFNVTNTAGSSFVISSSGGGILTQFFCIGG